MGWNLMSERFSALDCNIQYGNGIKTFELYWYMYMSKPAYLVWTCWGHYIIINILITIQNMELYCSWQVLRAKGAFILKYVEKYDIIETSNKNSSKMKHLFLPLDYLYVMHRLATELPWEVIKNYIWLNCHMKPLLCT